MKNQLKIHLIISLVLFSYNHAASQERQVLSVDEFEKQIAALDNEQLVDVRSRDEFRKGFLDGAFNIDINGRDFIKQVSALDKSRPVLIYCLSGARSAQAAAGMRRDGFQVIEMEGGLLGWNAKHKALPEKTAGPGLSLEWFNDQVKKDKLVLVDFHAPWCAPCKKMAPELEAIAKTYDGQIVLLKISADENRALVEALKVDALPGLFLFKDGKKVWSYSGLAGKELIEKQIRKNL